MVETREYGFCFGIGSACSCSESLRAAGMQFLSFPFDWIAANDGIRPRADMIAEGFRGFVELEDLEVVPSPEWHGKEFVRNRRIGHVQNHDFPKGVPIVESYPAVKAKYDRRIARLERCIRKSGGKVLVVCIDAPNMERPTTADDCRYVLDRLSDKYPGAEFEMLLLNCEQGVRAESPREETLDGGRIMRLVFDYRDHSPGAEPYAVRLAEVASVLRARFMVRDYRTWGERRAEKGRKRASKMGRKGSVGWLRYRLFKFGQACADLRRALAPRVLRARLRQRKFDHFVSLGVNCEVAFRFQYRWGFLDSSLFAWSQGYGLKNLIDTLGRLDDLGAGEMTQLPVSEMWQCGNTGMAFHGKLSYEQGKRPPPPEARIADREDLRGRIGYLREKFRAYARDDKSVLYAYRINSSECGLGVGERLDALQRALEAVGARNYTLLVVTEEAVAGRIPSAAHRVVRSVRRFNPMDRVTDLELGDTIGWDAVFTEFAPAVIQRKKHAFKFETH